MVVPPPLAFNPILEVFLVSRAKQISRKILIYAGGLKKHHIGSWCPGGHSFSPFLLRLHSQGVEAAFSLFVNRGDGNAIYTDHTSLGFFELILRKNLV